MRMISIDRIEEDIAVCEENGDMISLPLSSLPSDTKEGDILTLSENGWILSEDTTEKRKNSLLDLQNSLFDE